MQMPKIMHKYNWAVYGLALLFLIIAIYIHAFTIQNPYTGLLFRDNAGVWVVASVDPAGQAEKWDVHIGDRLLAIDGEQPDLIKFGDHAYLKHSGALMFEREGLGRFEVRNNTAMTDVYKGLFAASIELALLAIGLAAYRNKPESFMVRRFYALNVFMAATLLSVYSTETALTGLILPVVASWLPYLLLAFFVAFVFRSTPKWIGLAMAAYRVLAALFAAYVLIVFSLGAIPGWTRSVIHTALIGALLAIFIIAIAYRRSLDRAEKNRLLTFIAALAFGLLPYLFLYVLPDLLLDEYLAPPDMTLAGLIALPASILILWKQQRLFDKRTSLSKNLYEARSGLSGATLEYNLLEAQQTERVRTSYFLHDHVLQNLIFLTRDLEELHDTGQSDKRLTAVWLKCLYDTQRDIRMLCDDLYPHIVDQAGLGDALRWLARTLKENNGPTTKLDNKLLGALSPLYKITLFRIVRELANNAAKHAEADNLMIRLWETDNVIYSEVRDDGIGFDSATADSIRTSGRGFGLATISSQVAQFSGGIEIDSAPGRGTTVRIWLPKQGGEDIYGTNDQGAAAG